VIKKCYTLGGGCEYMCRKTRGGGRRGAKAEYGVGTSAGGEWGVRAGIVSWQRWEGRTSRWKRGDGNGRYVRREEPGAAEWTRNRLGPHRNDCGRKMDG
jgi:hypothetical protein